MLLIAGPCSAESPQQLMETARGLTGCGVSVFRAGLWKPRTHPGTFEGVGAEGLPWLVAVREETGLPVMTEVAGAKHVDACLKASLDALWIGARTTTNPFLVQEIAEALSGTDIPVYVKNPVQPDPELWAGAVERLQRAGVSRIGLIFRGFTTPESGPCRNAPLWPLAVGMRMRFPDLPLLVDPSHIAGEVPLVPGIAQKAFDLGLDGLMVEVHARPEAALSDADQQLTPVAFRSMIAGLQVRAADTDAPDYRESIEALRARIDTIDEQMLALLASRMDVSREIGAYKREHGITILQPGRWEALSERITAEGERRGLPREFVRKVFDAIHEESVRRQEK